jgi:anti-repressor protein
MQLIKVDSTTIGTEVKQTVNARDLHAFLEVGKDFSNWVKDRIESFGFVENQDFIVFAEPGEKGRPRIDYALTLDMAKELSMVERTDKGKQARQYFIECERVAKSATLPPIAPELQMAHAVLLAGKMIEEQKLQIEQRDTLISHLQPQADALHQLENADGMHNLTTAAKILNRPPHKFAADLSRKGWLYRMGITGPWTGRQEKINAGYLAHKIYRQEMPDGTELSRAQVLITPKGMSKLAVLYAQPELLAAA